MNINSKINIRSIHFLLVFIIPLLLVIFPLSFIINGQQVEGGSSETDVTANTTNAAIVNATKALENATQSIQSIKTYQSDINQSVQSIQALQNNSNPCKSNKSTVPSSIAIDSKKIVITPEDAFLNVLVYDKNNCLINKQVNIEVRYLGNGDQANTNINSIASRHDAAKLAAAVSASSSQQNNDPINGMPLIYDQTAPSTFFSKSGVPINNEGLYLVRASIPGQKELDYSWTFIDGVGLDHTRFAISMIFGIIAFIALLILSFLASKFVIFDKYSKEARFLLISIIVFSSIVALYFVSEELGVGAPVGLIKRPLINSTSITDLIPGSSGQQWVVNIGGVPENNYKFGLQIPIYVFVFGIIGGYIRYLYNTTQSQPDIRSIAHVRLFSWNNVPGRDEGSLKDFLRKKYKLQWITDQLKFTNDGKTLLLKDNTNNFLSITLDNDTAALHIVKNNKEENKKFIVKKENGDNIVYSEEYGKSNIFYSSLRDIALILLAPLLAAAVWFLIIQNGVDPAKGIYVLAVVSFAVGLATDNVVQTLVNFVNTSTRTRGIQTSTPPSVQ